MTVNPAQLDNESLVLSALVGNMAAYDELVRRFRGAVVAAARQIVGCHDMAEDVAQDVFLLAFKALPQLETPANFPGWLCAITRNRARRIAARNARSQAEEPQEMDRLILRHSAEVQPHPVDICVRRFEMSLVSAALDTLPPDYQQALSLRYYEEWSVQEIARFLSLPVTTVKWRLHQGRLWMRKRLEGQKGSASNERK